MRGRKPKPTAIKEREGNPGKRGLNTTEPKFNGSLPECPPFLGTEAKEEWVRVVNELYAAGVLTQMDTAVLAGYCVARARWIEAEEMIETEGAVYVNAMGNKVRSPWVIIAHQMQDKMLRFAAELGMTPSSRSRIHVKPPNQNGKLDKYRAPKTK